MPIAVAKARELPRSGQAILGALCLLIPGLAVGGHAVLYAAVPLLLVLAARLAELVLARWTLLLGGAIAVDLLIPEDDRYTLGGGAGFQLEPYRVVIGILLVGWLAALLIDPRVQWRRTRFERPLSLVAFAIIGSDLVNTDRIVGVGSFVIKALSLLVCFALLLYLVTSLVRTRQAVHRLLKVLVAAGCIEGIGGFVQRETDYNIFDHLHRFILIFSFNGSAELATLTRNGGLRAEASAGHPIELSTVTTMLIPIAIYLAIAHRRRWWLAVVVLQVGALSTGSKTGFLELIGVLMMFIWLRPTETLKCWPVLIPIVIVMNVVVPGSLSGIVSGFFPKGGFIASQSYTYQGRGGRQTVSRLSRIGPEIHSVYLKHNLLFGEGYGTRITGRTSVGGEPAAGIPAQNVGEVLDDQWFGTLLDTGILGVLGWLWLFTHVIRRLGRRAKRERGSPEGWLPVALAASLFSFAVGMLTYDAFTFIQAVVVFYVLVALAAVVLWLPAVADRPYRTYR